jgi:hypothetical protein
VYPLVSGKSKLDWIDEIHQPCIWLTFIKLLTKFGADLLMGKQIITGRITNFPSSYGNELSIQNISIVFSMLFLFCYRKIKVKFKYFQIGNTV